MDLRTALAAQLRAERAAADLTVEDLAARAGVSARSTHRYLANEVDMPTSALEKFAAAVGLRTSTLVRRAEERAAGDDVGQGAPPAV